MAKHLTCAPMLAQLLLAAGACLLNQLALAQAQALSDPTRPPTVQYAPAGSDTVQPAKPVLQSVLISPRRMEAIISGQTVRVGDKVGSARVVKIAESEVVLRSGNESQVLRLFPDIDKRTGSGRAGANADKRRQ